MSRICRYVLTCLILGVSAVCCAGAAPPELLTSAAAVRSLPPKVAAEGRPVRLKGFLVLVTAPRNAVVLLNENEGVYVALPRKELGELKLGEIFEVEGVTDAGDFAPVIRASRFARVGQGVLPPPRQTTIAELNAGGYDAAWVELRGIVRSCVPLPTEIVLSGKPPARPPTANAGPQYWQITFAQGADRMTALVSGEVGNLVDAEVRMRAVVFNVHNANRQFVRANLQVPHPSLIEVTAPPPADPFAREGLPVGDVLRFSRDGFSGHRVHVRGVVIGHEDGRTLWVREGENGMRISSSQLGRLQPGDVVDVAGFPDHGSYTPSLSDAVFRRVEPGPAPVPKFLKSADEIARHDSNLIQIHAKLRDVRMNSGGGVLVLDWNGREVEAQFMQPIGEEPFLAWRVGSQLRVAGICVAGQTDFRKPTGLWMADDLQLRLRDARDVAVLREAPWLTPERATAFVFTFGIAALSALIVVALVARRQISQREEARKLAEVEFAAMLAERNRLARDFHDTLAQDLNAVSMQLELAKNAGKAGGAESMGNFLGTAHEIVRKCIAEARESIWNMRSHILERHELPDALRLVAEQLAAGTNCVINHRVTGRARRMAPNIENNLLRLGQEAVSNALKHARATRINLELNYEDTRVWLRVVDDGTGFEPASVSAAPSHFGLRGMRERVAQMHGEMVVDSAPGSGTAISIRVDALPD